VSGKQGPEAFGPCRCFLGGSLPKGEPRCPLEARPSFWFVGSQEQSENCLKNCSEGPRSLYESKGLKPTPPFISVLNNETIDKTHRLCINMNKVPGSGKCRQLSFPGSAGLLVNIQHHFFSSYRKKAHIATLNLYRCKLSEKIIS